MLWNSTEPPRKQTADITHTRGRTTQQALPAPSLQGYNNDANVIDTQLHEVVASKNGSGAVRRMIADSAVSSRKTAQKTVNVIKNIVALNYHGQCKQTA